MNVVMAYLDTMFGAYPQTPRLLEAKVELRGMMEDAYASLIAEGHSENEAVGRVIRDFGNLEELAPMLGITSDLVPQPQPQPQPQTQPPAPAGASSPLPRPARAPYPPVTQEEAEGFADASERIRFRVGTALVLFVLAPTALIALPVAAESGVLAITQELGIFLGIVALLVLTATGVMLLLTTSREMAPYDRIPEGQFVADPEVSRWARELAERHERARIRSLQLAIALWILAPIPLIAFALFLDDTPHGDFWPIIGVVLVLVIVATGLGVLLPQTWARTVSERLSRGAAAGGAAPGRGDGERSIVGVIAAFYWPLLTAIFLAWSFIGNAWDRSWIVWPVGAMLFGVIAAGGNAIESFRRDRHGTRGTHD